MMAALRSAKRRSCPLVTLLFCIRAPITLPMIGPVAMTNNHILDIEPIELTWVAPALKL